VSHALRAEGGDSAELALVSWVLTRHSGAKRLAEPSMRHIIHALLPCYTWEILRRIEVSRLENILGEPVHVSSQWFGLPKSSLQLVGGLFLFREEELSSKLSQRGDAVSGCFGQSGVRRRHSASTAPCGQVTQPHL
jgi:hypothetical protein